MAPSVEFSIDEKLSFHYYPVDCSPPGSSIYGILQARILEWVAISFSNEMKKEMKQLVNEARVYYPTNVN